MVECSKCGSENHFDGAVFCKNCGEELGKAVAVDVAEQPDTKIEAAPVKPEATADDAEFTVEDVADPDDPVDNRPEPRSEGGGIDKLLSLYGNESKVEAARSLDEPEHAGSPTLGIESASDFLMRTQETDSDCKPSVESTGERNEEPNDNDAEAVARRNQEILSRLKPLEENVASEPATAGSAAGGQVSDADKGQLLDRLNKSLHVEPKPQEEVVAEFKDPLGKSRSLRNSEPATVTRDAVVEANDSNETQAAEPLSLTAISAERELAALRKQAVYLRGQKLTLPKNVNLRNGDEVTIQGQEYTVKPGTLDRRNLIIGAAAVAIVMIVLIAQSFRTPVAPKATIFGVVTNSESSEVLAGVTISIPSLNLMTVTDEQGVFKFVGLADGRYDVKMEGELYEERYFPLIVQNGQSDIMYGSVTPILPKSRSTNIRSLQPQTSAPTEVKSDYGMLTVNCNVPEAQVFLDGKSAGKVSQVLKRIRTGNRSLEVRAEGYATFAQPVEIVAGESTELAITLQSLQPDQPTEYSAQDFFDQAEALVGEQKYTEAVGYYTLALAKDNTMVRAYLRRAEAHLAAGKKLNARADYRSAADLYLNSGQYSQAILCYDKILEFQPNASDALTLRGWAKINSGSYDGGISDLEQALLLSPEDVQAQIDLGKALYIVGRYKDSEKHLKKLKKAAEESPEIFGYLALTHLAQGDENDARKNYEQFRKRANSALVARMSTESGWQRLTALAGN